MKNFFIKKILFLNIISFFLSSALLFSMEQQSNQLEKIKKSKNNKIRRRPQSWPKAMVNNYESITELFREHRCYENQTRKLFLHVKQGAREDQAQVEQLVSLVAMLQSQVAKQQSQIAQLTEQVQTIHPNHTICSNEKTNHKKTASKKKKRSKSVSRSNKVKREKSNKPEIKLVSNEFADLQSKLLQAQSAKKKSDNCPGNPDTVILTLLEQEKNEHDCLIPDLALVDETDDGETKDFESESEVLSSQDKHQSVLSEKLAALKKLMESVNN